MANKLKAENKKNQIKAVCLWSGGKDSALALYRAESLGYKILALFNFVENEKYSLSHGLKSEIVNQQTAMIGIPLIQKVMPRLNYRQEFKNIITAWKNEKGIEGVIFGDIYLQEHKDWIDKVCQELGVKAIMPLWGEDTKELILEIIGLGFKAIVVSTRAEVLGKEWLGRKINKKLIKELGSGIDPCGENGEFHTFVTDGPIFKKGRIKITKSRVVYKKDFWPHWVLDILEYKSVGK